MRCPKCGNGRCAYTEKRGEKDKSSKRRPERKDFTARCPVCKWEGVV